MWALCHWTDGWVQLMGGAKRILKLDELGMTSTRDGVKFECYMCNRTICLRDLINGEECPCGVEYDQLMVRATDES